MGVAVAPPPDLWLNVIHSGIALNRSAPRTDEEEEMERDATKGGRPAQSLGRAEIERSVTGGSVEGDSRRLVGPVARGEVVWPTDRDRASSYAQSGGARRGTHPT